MLIPQQEEVRKIVPRQPKEKIATLTYEDLGIPPIKDFDYKGYDKVNIFLFRIGADIVEVDIQVTSLKDLGVQKLYAQCIISVGSKAETWT